MSLIIWIYYKINAVFETNFNYWIYYETIGIFLNQLFNEQR